MKSKRHVPLILGLVSLAISMYLAVSVGGLLAIIIATLLAAFGFPSLKTAFFASDKEIQELTNPDMRVRPSEETEKKFEDRL